MQRKVKTVRALQNVSFKIRRGEIFGLLGPNGAGKTTTVNILSGIVTKDAGKVKFLGKEISEETKNKMNLTTAYAELMRYLTVYQNLKVFAKIYGVRNYEERIEELLKKFGVDELKDKRYYLLSSGEQTRVNLCKGLINKPELLLLDEATVGLDPDIRRKLWHHINELKSMGVTVILTTHYLDEAEFLSDRVCILSIGKVLLVESLSTLREKYQMAPLEDIFLKLTQEA